MLKRVCLALLLSVAVLANAVPAVAAENDGNSVLFQLSIKSPETLIKSLDAVIVASSENTKYASRYQPGTLMMLVNILPHVPLQVIEADKPMYFYVASSGGININRVIIFEAEDIKLIKEWLESLGLTVTADGENKLLFDDFLFNSSSEASIISLGAGRFMFVEKAAASERMKKLLADWTPPVGFTDYTLAARINMEGLLATYAPLIQFGLDNAKVELEDKIKTDSDIPENAKEALVKIVHMLIDGGYKAYANFSAIDIKLNLDKTTITGETIIIPKKDSLFAKFVAENENAENVTLDLTKTLPENIVNFSVVNNFTNSPPEVIDFFHNMALLLTTELFPEATERITAITTDAKKMATEHAGVYPVASALYRNDLGNPAQISYAKVIDKTLQERMLNNVFSLCVDIINKIAETKVDAPILMKPSFQAEAGKVGDLTYSEFKLTLVPNLKDDTADAAKRQELAEKTTELIEKLGNGITRIRTAMFDDYFVMVNSTGEDDLAYAINNLKEGKSGFAAKQEVAEIFAGVKEKNACFVLIRPIAMFEAMYGKLLPAEMLQKIMSMTSTGADETATYITGNAAFVKNSFMIRMDLPTKTINETVRIIGEIEPEIEPMDAYEEDYDEEHDDEEEGNLPDDETLTDDKSISNNNENDAETKNNE